MAHWHDFNPWAATCIYVPDLLELAHCVAPDWPVTTTQRWVQEYGPKLDAYLLPQPSGEILVGIRYGKEGSEYLSPYGQDQAGLRLLVAKYGAH